MPLSLSPETLLPNIEIKTNERKSTETLASSLNREREIWAGTGSSAIRINDIYDKNNKNI